ncbi:MAG: hypothetical protein AAGA56_19325, partial [Myxococcota bacterium]
SKMFSVMLGVGLVAAVGGGALAFYHPETHWRQFFHTGWGGIVYLTGVNFLIMVGARFLERHLRHILWWLVDALNFFSERVTAMYIVSWVIICWGMGIFGFWAQDVTGTLLAIPFTLGGTLLVQRFIDARTRQRESRQDLVPAAAE